MEKIIKIREIQHSIEMLEKGLAALHRLSLSELLVLLSLKDGKSHSASKIASSCKLSATNTSKILKKLEQKYLIERSVGKVDRRVMNFNITKEGKSIITKVNYREIELPGILSRIIE